MRFEKDWGRLGLKFEELSQVSSYVSERIRIDEVNLDNYVSTENMISERGGVTKATKLPSGKTISVFQKGDILISNIRPYFKKIWLADKSGGCSNDVLVVRANEKISNRFLYYVLSSDNFFDYAVGTSKGTKMPRGDKKAIMKYKVPIYSLVEQEKIAEVLRAFDKKIILNKQINHHLAAISKNYLKIFHSNNSIKLGDLFELKSGYAFKSKDWVDEGKPVIKIKDIDGITIDITNLNYVKNKSQLAKASNFEVFGKEIVMALTGATTGKIGVIPKNFKGYVNQRVGLFYAKTELSYAVLWSILQQQNIITDLIELSSGSAQANLSPSSVNSYDLNVTLKDLIELDKIISPLYELFCFNLSEIQRLSELRDTLLPKLLSGELSVNQATK